MASHLICIGSTNGDRIMTIIAERGILKELSQTIPFTIIPFLTKQKDYYFIAKQAII
jgi:hypothetical protein